MSFLRTFNNSSNSVTPSINTNPREGVIQPDRVPVKASSPYLAKVLENTTPQIEHRTNRVDIKFTRNSLPVGVGRMQGRNNFKLYLTSDYDFTYMERMYEREGIVRKYVTTATAKALRAGFNLMENPEYTGPISRRKKEHAEVVKRHNEILKASNLTWYEVLQTSLKELFHYGNSIIKKSLDGQGSITSLLLDDLLFYEIGTEVKDGRPLSYVRRPSIRARPSSEQSFNNNKYGILQLTTQIVSSDTFRRDLMSLYGLSGYGGIPVYKKEEFKKEEIIHFRYMMEKNAPFSIPPALASVIDIEDLRTLEENLVLLGWQYGHPILHVSVNTEGLGHAQTDAEIDRVIQEIEAMDSTGFLVTSHRTELKLHYPNGSLIPIDKFVDYLQNRAKSNLDTSSLLLGDGSNAGRQAGESIEASAGDIIQMVAQVAGQKLQSEYVDVLYQNIGGQESSSSTIIRVNEIDRTIRAARTNQLINLMNSRGASADLVRDDMNLGPITEEEWNKIERQALIAKKGDDGIPNVNPSNQYGEGTPGSTKD